MKSLRLNSRSARVSYKNVVLSSFEVRLMAIEDLTTTVRPVPAFAEEVRASIEASGLQNPVIVIRLPREDFISFFASIDYNAEWLPDKPVLNIVCGGANRVFAAKEMGYTHIDCVLIPDPYLAQRVQAIQRGSYGATSEES